MAGIRSNIAGAAHGQHQSTGEYWFLRDGKLLAVVGMTWLSYVLEGPIRYLLHLVRASSLLYLRDLLGVAVVALAALSGAVGQSKARPLLMVCVALLFHCAIGLLSLPSPIQALFGLKVFVVFLLGLAAAPALHRRREVILPWAWWTFGLTVVGVSLNRYIDYPWIGLETDTVFGAAEGARRWWGAGGELRLPGFARASFTAAIVALLAAIPLLAGPAGSLKKLGVLCAAAYTIHLTTSRGAFTSLIALVLSNAVLWAGTPALAAGLLMLQALACLALPVVGMNLPLSIHEVPRGMQSLMQRFYEMWPQAFALFDDRMQWVWGRGLGGIGVAQLHGEADRINTADNLIVYVMVAFGLCGILYFALLIGIFIQYFSSRGKSDLCAQSARGWLTVWLAYGLTGGMVDNPAMSLAAGTAFGLALVAGEGAS